MRWLRNSARNHAVRVYVCMLHTWSTGRYTCILGCRWLHSYDCPILVTHPQKTASPAGTSRPSIPFPESSASPRSCRPCCHSPVTRATAAGPLVPDMHLPGDGNSQYMQSMEIACPRGDKRQRRALFAPTLYAIH